jgi:hypothetical protein
VGIFDLLHGPFSRVLQKIIPENEIKDSKGIFSRLVRQLYVFGIIYTSFLTVVFVRARLEIRRDNV